MAVISKRRPCVLLISDIGVSFQVHVSLGSSVRDHCRRYSLSVEATQILPPHVIISTIQFVKDATYFRLFNKK